VFDSGVKLLRQKCRIPKLKKKNFTQNEITNDNEFVNIATSFYYQTRNSAVVDKLHNTFVQMQWHG